MADSTEKKRKTFKVLSTFCKNFMGVPDGNYDFQGKSVFLVAKNSKGKSDLMTMIVDAALQNKTPDKPIRAGEKDANLRVTLVSDGAEYTIDVYYKKTDKELVHYFEIQTPDNFKSRKVESLRQLVGGSVGFDVEKFIRNTDTIPGVRENIATIRRFLGEEVAKQLDQIDIDKKKTQESRELLNKRIVELNGLIAASNITNVDILNCAKGKIVTAELSARYKAAMEHEKKKTDQQGKVDRANKEITALNEEISQMEAALEKKKLARDEKRKESADAQAELIKMPAQAEKVEDIEKEINTADAHNALCDKVELYNKNKQEKEEKYEQWKEKAKLYGEYDDKKKKILSESPLPVNGLTFDEDGIYIKFDDKPEPIPINCLSTSERTKLIAVPLAIAENPKVKLIHIGNAESMDWDTIKEIQAYADKFDYQVFYEEVDRGVEQLKVRFSEDVIKN